MRQRRRVSSRVRVAIACAATAAVLGPLTWFWQTSLLPETINPYLEVSSFGVVLSAPHLMFGLALTLACAPIYVRAINGERLWLAVLAVTVGVLSLVHSFNTPVLVSILVAHAIATPSAFPHIEWTARNRASVPGGPRCPLKDGSMPRSASGLVLVVVGLVVVGVGLLVFEIRHPRRASDG